MNRGYLFCSSMDKTLRPTCPIKNIKTQLKMYFFPSLQWYTTQYKIDAAQSKGLLRNAPIVCRKYLTALVKVIGMRNVMNMSQ